MNSGSRKLSTFTALQNPVFRRLWLASLISGACVAAHDTAAVWVMNTLSSSALSLSMISTVASLPLFLFTLPAGVSTDMVNRQKLLRCVNLCLAFAAGLLAILGSLRLLSPNVLLFCVFMIGLGFAFNAPAWSAFVSDVVAVEELPSAATLGGLQLNVSGIKRHEKIDHGFEKICQDRRSVRRKLFPEPRQNKNSAENRANSHGSKQQTEAAGLKVKFLQAHDRNQRWNDRDEEWKQNVSCARIAGAHRT
jgi:hypothetical protein